MSSRLPFSKLANWVQATKGASPTSRPPLFSTFFARNHEDTGDKGNPVVYDPEKEVGEQQEKRDPDDHSKVPVKEPEGVNEPEEDVRAWSQKKAAPRIDLGARPRGEKELITVQGPVRDISMVAEIPEQHIRERYVRIYKPARNVMQAGTENTKRWRIEFEARERWENPLIGWTSSGDPLSYMEVDFQTKEDAIAFVEKNGWSYYIDEPPKTSGAKKKFRPGYGEIFSWNKRTRTGTK